MVELRKRKAPPAESAAPPPLKKINSLRSDTKAVAPAKRDSTAKGSSSPVKVAVGDIINLDGFGGDISTHSGEKTTLKKLLEGSRSGVVLFTYPKASTPGCTTQACLFRDSFTSLTATGYSIYGLSVDSPKSNASFKTKQNLPYTLLCDPYATLIAAIGMKKAPKGTTRGVFVINKQAKIEVIFAGGPAATVNEVRKLIDEASEDEGINPKGINAARKVEDIETQPQESEEPNEPDQPSEKNAGEVNGDVAQAEVAAEVADTAEKLDQGV